MSKCHHERRRYRRNHRDRTKVPRKARPKSEHHHGMLGCGRRYSNTNLSLASIRSESPKIHLEHLFHIRGILFAVRLRTFKLLEPMDVTCQASLFSKLIVPSLIFGEPTVRSNLMVEFSVNEVIAVLALREVSLLVWIPVHGLDLSMLGNGYQSWNFWHRHSKRFLIQNCFGRSKCPSSEHEKGWSKKWV